ncbi:MAG: hypothetical protein HOP08_19280 [Cyclobacteriaceae bacterium]|nr:hypothetical protein [Cyclobacteriaceae bacterium]
MEKITTIQDDKLLNYLDGKLNELEVIQLRKELEASAVLQARLEDLRLVHRTLAHTTLDTPSMAFTNKVMLNLHSQSFPTYLSPKNGLLLLGGIIIAAGMLVVMITAGIFDQVNGPISLDKTLPVSQYFKQSLPTVSINGKLVVKIIVGLNLVLAFFILDRTVLKPFFQKRAGTQL